MPLRTRMAAVPCAFGLLTMFVGACGGGSLQAKASPSAVVPPRPSSTAQLKILLPKAGDVLGGPTVNVRVGLTGAKIVDFTSTNLEPNEGHLHVLLDGRLISMTLGLEQEIPNVAAGSHLIRVEFVANDHAPFNPRVVQEVAFEVS